MMIKSNLVSAKVSWTSPANLAIIKYWGKKGVQEPLNPSVSFVLEKSVTTTRVTVTPAREGDFSFYLEGVKNVAFGAKIKQFLELAKPFIPFLNNHHLNIESFNSFPHSSGIASSASSASALAFCLASIHLISQGKKPDEVDKIMVSGLARLGSGSACRSVYGGWCAWGKNKFIKNSSNSYALPVENQVNPVFNSLLDTILLIDTTPKKVSSSKGHGLMEHHPYRDARVEQANVNFGKMLSILETGNLFEFFDLAESESLSLHGLMMNSNPWYILLHPNTIRAMEIIRKKRVDDGLLVGFSLDAGPNVHLLYPASVKEQVRGWIENELIQLCDGAKIIHDQVGNGPIHGV